MKNNPSSEWIIVEGTHEGIVDEALFQEANLALSSRMKARNENTNWENSGNLFVCGCCGREGGIGDEEQGFLCDGIWGRWRNRGLRGIKGDEKGTVKDGRDR